MCDAQTQTDLVGEDLQKLEEAVKTKNMVEDSFNPSIKKSIKKLTYYTGLPNVQVFLLILNTIDEYLTSIKIKKLSNFQKLLIVLMKLRLNVDFTDLSYRFDVRISSVSELFKKVVICLPIDQIDEKRRQRFIAKFFSAKMKQFFTPRYAI